MATSGTSAFKLDLGEMIEEAYDRCGLRSQTGYDFKSARRSLDLMFVEWQNRGTNMWLIDELTVPLVAGTINYVLPVTVFDFVECYIRTGTGVNQTDLPITRIHVSEYATIPNKNSNGRPVNVWLDKQRDAPEINVWPRPDQAYTFVYHALSRIEDAQGAAGNADTDPDLPYRFLPVVVAGLAAKIAVKKLTDQNKIMFLRSEYEEAWADAIAGDRDRASWRFRPHLPRR